MMFTPEVEKDHEREADAFEWGRIYRLNFSEAADGRQIRRGRTGV